MRTIAGLALLTLSGCYTSHGRAPDAGTDAGPIDGGRRVPCWVERSLFGGYAFAVLEVRALERIEGRDDFELSMVATESDGLPREPPEPPDWYPAAGSWHVDDSLEVWGFSDHARPFEWLMTRERVRAVLTSGDGAGAYLHEGAVRISRWVNETGRVPWRLPREDRAICEGCEPEAIPARAGTRTAVPVRRGVDRAVVVAEDHGPSIEIAAGADPIHVLAIGEELWVIRAGAGAHLDRLGWDGAARAPSIELRSSAIVASAATPDASRARAIVAVLTEDGESIVLEVGPDGVASEHVVPGRFDQTRIDVSSNGRTTAIVLSGLAASPLYAVLRAPAGDDLVLARPIPGEPPRHPWPYPSTAAIDEDGPDAHVIAWTGIVDPDYDGIVRTRLRCE